METDVPIAFDEFYRTLVENTPEGMVTIDEDSTIRYANPATEDILCYSQAELIGSPKMTIIPERLRPIHTEALASYLESGERNVDRDRVEFPVRHKDGPEIPALISLREHTHDGQRYFTGIVRDISERRAREAELQDKKDRLDDFADILAHDIRNPLSVAQGYTDLAAQRHHAPELETVSDSLDRIEKLVDDVLALSKEGRYIGETEQVTVGECARTRGKASTPKMRRSSWTWARRRSPPTRAASANCSRTCFAMPSTTAANPPPFVSAASRAAGGLRRRRRPGRPHRRPRRGLRSRVLDTRPGNRLRALDRRTDRRWTRVGCHRHGRRERWCPVRSPRYGRSAVD